MALEAFFYDYAAEHLGDAFVQEHIDRLDLRSKFLVFPQLVCGKRPEKANKTYGQLTNLVSLRNLLVHFKSRPFGLEKLNEAGDFHDNLNVRMRKGVDLAVEAVRSVVGTNGVRRSSWDSQIFLRLMTWSSGN
jgi:hypothetical protein